MIAMMMRVDVSGEAKESMGMIDRLILSFYFRLMISTKNQRLETVHYDKDKEVKPLNRACGR
jgi:hypothetical protein